MIVTNQPRRGFAIARQLGLDGYNIVMVATGPGEKPAAVDALQKQASHCAYVGEWRPARLRILDAALTAFGRGRPGEQRRCGAPCTRGPAECRRL
ncbi:MAG: hypothetical protein ACLRI7_03165 [Ruthenibacterium lactatiformans]